MKRVTPKMAAIAEAYANEVCKGIVDQYAYWWAAAFAAKLELLRLGKS